MRHVRQQQLLSLREAAAELGLSVSALRALASRGVVSLPLVRVSTSQRSKRYVRRADLDAFLTSTTARDRRRLPA
jgi:hypothetical protein